MSTLVYSFRVDWAEKYGDREAILLSNLQFWIARNKANGKHCYDGRTWTYNTRAAYRKLFPFWSEDQLKRLFSSLIERGILVRGEYNENAYDRTAWHAFANEEEFLSVEFIDEAKSPAQAGEIAQSTGRNRPLLTDNKPDSKPDVCAADASATPKKKSPKAKARTSLSEDWKLADRDREYALSEGVPAPRLEREVQRFRDHHISKGSLMADWSAAWRTWVGNYLKWNPKTETAQPDDEQAKWSAIYQFFDETGRWRESAHGPAPYMPGHRGPRKVQPQQALI
jgi:hypothetical protein